VQRHHPSLKKMSMICRTNALGSGSSSFAPELTKGFTGHPAAKNILPDALAVANPLPSVWVRVGRINDSSMYHADE